MRRRKANERAQASVLLQDASQTGILLPRPRDLFAQRIGLSPGATRVAEPLHEGRQR
jgi:hypothetical protein